MSWILLIGAGMAGWTLLLLVSSERQSRIAEIESKRQHALLAAQQAIAKQGEIPHLK